MKYAAIIVLAQKQVGRWGLPADLKKRLDEAILLYQKGETSTIIVCGRWAIYFDLRGIIPPITESKRMKQYLLRHGIPRTAILTENHSKDTIGNAYYLKQLLKHKQSYKKLLVICGTPHIPRVSYIFDHIFGEGYHLKYLGIETARFPNSPAKEQEILDRTKAYLGKIPAGHDEKLRYLLYRNGYRRQILRMERTPD